MIGTQQEEIMDLRPLNLTPKQIARKLGIKVSSVNAAIQNQVQQSTLDRLAKGELDPVYQCLASESLIRGNDRIGISAIAYPPRIYI